MQTLFNDNHFVLGFFFSDRKNMHRSQTSDNGHNNRIHSTKYSLVRQSEFFFFSLDSLIPWVVCSIKIWEPIVGFCSGLGPSTVNIVFYFFFFSFFQSFWCHTFASIYRYLLHELIQQHKHARIPSLIITINCHRLQQSAEYTQCKQYRWIKFDGMLQLTSILKINYRTGKKRKTIQLTNDD